MNKLIAVILMKNAKFILCLLYGVNIFADQRVHIGAGAGYKASLISKYQDSTGGTIARIKNSEFYSAKIGYEFSPGIHIELEGQNHKRSELNLKIKSNLNAISTLSHNDFYLNILYDLNPIGNLTPFFLFGKGMSNILIEKKEEYDNKKNLCLIVENQNSWLGSWNAGLGLNLPIHNNIYVELIAKVSFIPDFQIKYQKLENGKMAEDIIKKNLGNGEISANIKFKL